jgi:hypothetical protein
MFDLLLPLFSILSFSSMDTQPLCINNCQIDEKKWQCPDKQCEKVLSRKQTLIEHVRSFHPTLHIGNYILTWVIHILTKFLNLTIWLYVI